MADIVDRATRGRMMAGIRGQNTVPEVTLRRGLHSAGLRFRLHSKELPGKPDLVFPKYHAAIFVNGCFWHAHECPLFRWPSTRTKFWKTKLLENRKRDFRVRGELISLGWRYLVVWECTMKNKSTFEINQIIRQVATWIRKGSPPTELPPAS
jgi:DNA mismatch endonuclease (patch repair protein)